MESQTKNRQQESRILSMVQAVFGGQTGCCKIEELTEGAFNAVYFITLANGKETVLKIAPPPKVN